MGVNIEASWKNILQEEFSKDYFLELVDKLKSTKAIGKRIYPAGSAIFKAFDLTPFKDVKIVILGQDPYHGPGEAMGLCFSVPRACKIPPSLRNVFKELNLDLEIPKSEHGDLTVWAKQGVFLLNSVLTVEHKSPGSHRKLGWQRFTDEVIRKLSAERKDLVFMLWGNYAKAKSSLIDEEKHLILKSAHPSPFTGNAFFNNKHFSKANAFLKKQGIEEINWDLNKDE